MRLRGPLENGYLVLIMKWMEIAGGVVKGTEQEIAWKPALFKAHQALKFGFHSISTKKDEEIHGKQSSALFLK